MSIVGPDSPNRTPLVCTGREGPFTLAQPDLPPYSTWTPERWQEALERFSKDPHAADPCLVKLCPVCHACAELIVPGQFYTRIPLGPGADPAKRRAMRAGIPFDVVFAIVHWACATGDEGSGAGRIVVPT